MECRNREGAKSAKENAKEENALNVFASAFALLAPSRFLSLAR